MKNKEKIQHSTPIYYKRPPKKTQVADMILWGGGGFVGVHME
jgi:hypothetical protein